MNWIHTFAAGAMFMLFLVLALAIAARALPLLIVPLLTGIVVLAIVALIRFGR